jgi:XTP/dITP diphosphohydrolase
LKKRPALFDIVLATRNPNKIVEIKDIIGDLVNIMVIRDRIQIDIPEIGRSLLENSLAKATFTNRLYRRPVLADDSGLFVDSLDGEPGIYSSRYGKNDEERIARLLVNLGDKKNRRAVFRVIFVYYCEPGKYEVFEGECVGAIGQMPRGEKGFGYDPIFIPRGYKKTFAELGPSIKNRISHRARALEKFRAFIIDAAKE